MEPKTYQAATMAKALAEVKRDLGPSAVILHTRRFREGGVLGLLGGHFVWEVQAAPNVNVLPRVGSGKSGPTGERDRSQSGPETPSDQDQGPDIGAAAGRQATSSNPQVMDVISEVLGLAEAASSRADPSSPPLEVPPEAREPEEEQARDSEGSPGEDLEALRERLLEQEVDPEITDQILTDLQGELSGQGLRGTGALEEIVTEIIARRITVSTLELPGESGGSPRLISVIGPTGVGKTTTIAKLAADYKIRRGRAVGLITIDTYRIAAVDQLRTYADILQVPIQPVLTPGELHGAVHGMEGLDVVFIDTVGRSQNDEMKLRELGRFMEAAGDQEVYLGLSAASSQRVAMTALKRFSPLGVSGIIFTKLDEATNFGMILNIASATDAGIVYVTSGQEVPTDIALPNSETLARCIVRGRWNES